MRACVVAVVLGIAVGGCGDISGLDGSIGDQQAGSIGVTKGEPGDFTAFLVNHSGRPVTLVSASLLRFKGFPAPRLVGVAVETGKGFMGAGRGWPGKRPGVPIARFAGYVLRTGRRVQILYAITGAKLGVNYVADGVMVNLRQGSLSATIHALGPGAVCVRGHNTACPNSFDDAFSNATTPADHSY